MRVCVVRRTKIALLSVGALVASCTPPSGGPQQPHPDLNVLTQTTLAESHFQTAYDAVRSLRSNWLNAKGPDSFTTPTEVRVYLNGTSLGGVETLREIATPTLVSIRHYDGIAATARWGLGHGAGVIYVSTREDSGEPGDRSSGKPPGAAFFSEGVGLRDRVDFGNFTVRDEFDPPALAPCRAFIEAFIERRERSGILVR